MKPCPSCHKSLAENATSCPQCGHKFRKGFYILLSCAAFIVVILVFTWYGFVEYYSAKALNSRLQSVNKIRSNALSESLVNSETCRTKQEKDQALQIIRQRIAESKQRVATMEETIALTKNRSQKNALNDAIEKEMIAQEVMQGHLERVYDKLINYP